MKSVLLTTLLSMSIGTCLFASETSGTSTFKDYIENEKDHIFSVVAETQNETMLYWYARGFFGIGYSDREKVLEDACLNMGGTITEKKKGEAFSMKCSAPNQQGFTAQKVSNGNHGDLHYLVKHDSPQIGGYAMKGYVRINELDKKPLTDVLVAGESSSNFFNAYGYCLTNNGKYVISNIETDKKPVSAETYLEGRMNKVLHSLFTQGNHWCVVPGQEGKALFELSATFSSTGYPILKKEYVMDVPVLDKLESYKTMVTRKKLQESAQNNDAPSNTDEQMKISKKPSAVENDLASKVFKIKDTVLSRQGGNILEGIYLGENDQGCQLVAVSKSSGQQYTHNFLTLSANAPEWIMNFKQCQGKPTEYLGESFEKIFPSDYKVEMEFRRVVDMCKVRGTGIGSYLGYNMDCKRLGDTLKPVYEVTMTKKERLVMRSYEK
ncbi:hypothetical protein [Sulfuricurvum sp.]|uniref:hypothetical protein n=1 Tax=Sulfuricurvum sp. TaxID=2025608 RepID=UPI002603C7ED|nr:hypothetical protein [Sulfuricurvum sp.]MDD4950508.1 hypothetical protein [Sulfuricurvum sp.]